MEQGQCTSERNLPWIRKNGHVKFLKSSLSLPFSPSFPTRNEKLLADPERLRQISERIPAGRWGEPADFVGPVVFLASNASQYVCGELLVVDGVRYRFFWCSPLSSSPCLLRLSTSLFFFFFAPFFSPSSSSSSPASLRISILEFLIWYGKKWQCTVGDFPAFPSIARSRSPKKNKDRLVFFPRFLFISAPNLYGLSYSPPNMLFQFSSSPSVLNAFSCALS